MNIRRDINYYDNGNINYIIHYNDNNERHGESIGYHRIGGIDTRANYKNGKEHGAFLSLTTEQHISYLYLYINDTLLLRYTRFNVGFNVIECEI